MRRRLSLAMPATTRLACLPTIGFSSSLCGLSHGHRRTGSCATIGSSMWPTSLTRLYGSGCSSRSRTAASTAEAGACCRVSSRPWNPGVLHLERGDPVPRLARMATSSAAAAAVTLTYRRAISRGVVGHAAGWLQRRRGAGNRTVPSAVDTLIRTYKPGQAGASREAAWPERREAPMMAVLDPEAPLGLDDGEFREVVSRHLSRRSDPDGTVWRRCTTLR